MAHITRTSSTENLVQDFSRLSVSLKGRPTYSQRIAKEEFIKMTDQMKKDEFIWPKTSAIKPSIKYLLSEKIDDSVLRIYNDVVHQVQGTEEHRKNLKALRDAPKTCGGFKDKTALLKTATPLEQMIALDHLIDNRASSWKKGVRTICLGTKDSDALIPVYLLSKDNVPASTMTTRLGSGSRGQFKVPRYDQLASDSYLANNSPFAAPLEALEIVRQPYFAGATLLKGNAFSTKTIDSQRRYEILDPNNLSQNSQFTCVEPPKQNNPHLSPVKAQSAGSNLLSLEKKSPKKPLSGKLHFDDLAPEGYKDDVVLEVRPKNYWQAVCTAVLEDDTAELDLQTTILFLKKFGKFSSPVVNTYYADKLFKED